LQEKFGYNKEIRRIARHRHLPKYLVNAKNVRQVQKESKYRKMKNMEMNNGECTIPNLLYNDF